MHSKSNDQDNLSRRVSFYGLNADNYAVYPAIQKAIQSHCEGALKNFYAKVAATPETSKLFSSRQAMDRVAANQTAQCTQLFSGPPHVRYFQAAEAVGQVHARPGHAPRWDFGGYGRQLAQLMGKVRMVPEKTRP